MILIRREDSCIEETGRLLCAHPVADKYSDGHTDHQRDDPHNRSPTESGFTHPELWILAGRLVISLV
jgi:hypothetical protein